MCLYTKPLIYFLRQPAWRAARGFVILLLLGNGLMQMPVKPAAAAPLMATITVNTTADEYGTGTGCSLREAITAANTGAAFGGCPAGSPGAAIINLPAGAYTLTIGNTSNVNEDNNAKGDLDINQSLTIQGAGAGSTIIQAGTDTSNGIDKVFGINPLCASGVNVTIQGVTIRYGRNTQPYGASDFSFTGGGLDWCGGGTGSFSLLNAVVSDNTNVYGYGGGLNTDSVSGYTGTITINNVTFQNNHTLASVSTSTGGALNLFGYQSAIIISNSTFQGNGSPAGSLGGAIYYRPSFGGSLQIDHSSFANNSSGSGGAIAVSTSSTAATLTIQNSTISNNMASTVGGGLSLDGSAITSSALQLNNLLISGNTAATHGGGIYVNNATANVANSRIVNNTATSDASSNGLYKDAKTTTLTASNNWWGCSTGPSAAPCDTAVSAGGTLTYTPWLRDQLTAATSPLVTNQSTALTASFLSNSASGTIPVANLSQLISQPVTWAANSGSLSGTQATIQSTGTAAATYSAGGVGSALISAKVDNDNTSGLSSNILNLTINKANTTTLITSDLPDPSTPGAAVTVAFNVTGAFGNAPIAPTGLVTVSDGTSSCSYTLIAADAGAGSCALTINTVGAKNLTATYAGDTNFNTSTSAAETHLVGKYSTSTTITSDLPDPSVSGQAVTFNVSVVSTGSGTIGGSATVSDGGTNSCVATLTAGIGSCVISFPTPGTYTLTAAYAGDPNFDISTSATENHVVGMANTTTTITSDLPDPSTRGQAVSFNYTVVASAPGAGTPTGTVTVSDGGGNSCTGSVAAGSCTINFPNTGSASLTAVYSGDGSFNASTSAVETHTINKANTTTAITADNPDPSVVGQVVTVDFTVTSAATGTPGGNVTISDGTNSCIATVAAGSCSITYTSPGTKTLTATYAGDTDFTASTSASETHIVNPASTTTVIVSDTPDPSRVGEPVTVNFSVAVVSPGAGTPSGSVTISDGSDSCTGTLAAGACALTFTSSGTKLLTATYAGDVNFDTSTSATLTHTVNNAATTTTISADTPDPSRVGESVTVNFSVAVVAPGAGTPTGNVTVSDGTSSCTASVAAGSCTLTFSSVGLKTLTAVYAGDTNFSSSTSAGVTHTVSQGAVNVTISSDLPDPSLIGESVAVNYTVSATAPAIGTPSGTVTVSDGVDSCSASVAAGTCTLALHTLGARTLTATYSGDVNFTTGTSAGQAHTVSSAPTTTTITAQTPDPSLIGESVTVNFSVAVVAPGIGTPTGNVTVSDGSDSCVASVAAGACALAFTSVGTRTLTAVYAGDANFSGSTSAGVSHTVSMGNVNVSISSHLPNPSLFGESVIVNYVVSALAPASGTPSGTVTISDGVDSCSASVTAGTCALVFHTLGTRTLTVSYAGDANFSSNSASGWPHMVARATTTSTIQSALPEPSLVGEVVNIQFSVSANPPASGTPTGNVTVSDGTDSCTGTLTTGSCTITFTSIGTRSLTATYAGDTNYYASTSSSINHVVSKPSTTTTILSDAPDPSLAGASVNVTYSVAVVAPGTGAPTGNVTVSDGTNSCTSTVAAGACSVKLNTPGLRALTAAYAGDTNFNGSTSTDESHEVQKAPAFSSPDNTHFSVGTSGSFTIITSGYPAAAITQTGTLPASLTLTDNGDGTASLTGTPLAGDAGVYALTLQATNSVASATQAFTLTISMAPVITSANNVTFVQGTLGIFTITSTGDPIPTLSQTGALPGGISFTDNTDGTATLKGTPTVAAIGAYPLTITASNGTLPRAIQAFTLTVDGPPAVAKINSVTRTSDDEITENEHTPVDITQLLVVFNKDMNATEAGTSTNYSLVQEPVTTSTVSFDSITSNGMAPLAAINSGLVLTTATSIKIDSVAYDNSTATTTLGINGGVALPEGKYALTVKKAIHDTFGAALSADFTRTFFIDTTGIKIITDGVTLPNNSVIVDGSTLNTSFAKILVKYNEDAANPPGDTQIDDVTNPANYRLVRPGIDGVFETQDCINGLGGDDVAVPVGPVTYENGAGTGPFIARVQINKGVNLGDGSYKLFVCGTTSVTDLAGNKLNDGSDHELTFTILATTSSGNGSEYKHGNPATGFEPGIFTALPWQPVEKAYTDLGSLWIEIPGLGLKTSITGVPLLSDSWDLTWLNHQVGWLQGTAFPTWNGNSVLTAHAYTADGLPGPFVALKGLKYGDTFAIHLNGQKYTYMVQSKTLVTASDTSLLTKHETLDWVTLITCQQYDEKSKTYLYRWVVRAVLTSVQNDK